VYTIALQKLFVNKDLDSPESPFKRGLQAFGSVPSFLRRVREDQVLKSISASSNLFTSSLSRREQA
jgi:hypothetical protein